MANQLDDIIESLEVARQRADRASLQQEQLAQAAPAMVSTDTGDVPNFGLWYAQLSARATALLTTLGYATPRVYSAGLVLNEPTQTVEYQGDIYAAYPSALPFVTTGTFEVAKFRVIQGLTRAELSSDTGTENIRGTWFNNFKAKLSDLAGSVGSSMIGHGQPGSTSPFRSIAQWLNERPISVKAFGAVGDGVTDDAPAFQRWMNYIHDNNRAGYVPAGDFYHATQVVKTPSFYCPVINGAGLKSTHIRGPGNTSAWKIVGGSGGPSGGRISGMSFHGMNEDTGVGIIVQDQCGLPITHCAFYTSRYGGLLINDFGFTEYVTFEHCEFGGDVRTDLGYKRTGGTDSFHGSGIRSSFSNEGLTANTAKIEIGGPLVLAGVTLATSNNVIVYNSILEYQCWKQTAQPFIKNYSTRPRCDFHGDVTFEIFGENKFDFAESVNNGIVFFGGSGDVTELNNCVRRGAMLPYSHLSGMGDGSSRPFLSPYRVQTKIVGGGTTEVARLYSTGGEVYDVTVTLALTTSPFIKTTRVTCALWAGLTGQVTSQLLFQYFGGDAGPDPVWTMDPNGGLYVTMADGIAAGTLVVNATVVQKQFPIGSTW